MMFGKNALYDVAAKIKEEIVKITDPEVLRSLYAKLRRLDYTEQKTLKAFIIAGGFVSNFTEFKARNAYNSKRKHEKKPSEVDTTTTTTNVQRNITNRLLKPEGLEVTTVDKVTVERLMGKIKRFSVIYVYK
jgi:hypothetical protein